MSNCRSLQSAIDDDGEEERIARRDRGRFGRRGDAGIDQAEQDYGERDRRQGAGENHRHLRPRRSRLARKSAPPRDGGDDDHHPQRHDGGGNQPAHEHGADGRIGDQRVEDHRDRRRHQRPERRRNHRGRGRKAPRIAVVLRHHARHDQAGAGGIGHCAAAHAGEDQVGDDVDLREPAGQMADHRRAEPQQALDHAAGIHDIGDEDEHRHGDQQIAVVKPVHRLIDDKACVLMRRNQIDEACAQHGKAERRPEHRHEREHAEQDPETVRHPSPLRRC